MAAVPVTVAQYATFDPDHRSYFADQVPAQELATRWLSAAVPWLRGARLPTEEEWEHACRAGTQTRYWSGNEVADLERVGWYLGNSGNRTHRVGKKPANPYGLFDLHGNVWEWTLSPATKDYSERKAGLDLDPRTVNVADPAALSGARVTRGGCYWLDALKARAAYRGIWFPEVVDQDRGFRVVLPVPSPHPAVETGP
jgi:formylglycine-generating enzyme required for sulfatase activity